MITVILTVAGLVAISQGWYWLALLILLLAISIRGVFAIGLFISVVVLVFNY